MVDEINVINFMKNKDYIMVNDKLGGGAFGKTVLVKDPYIDELFVVKMYKPRYKEIQEIFYKNFLDEIKILHKLNHKNIVRIYNYYCYESQYTGYIFMEYIDGKNIEEYFRDYMPFPFPDSLDDVFIQLIDGFSYLEEKHIIHRDIREGNILVDNSGTVKIIDFGIGKELENVFENEDSLRSIINRDGLNALPKEFINKQYNSKTDMFYLAELFNRLLKKYIEKEYDDFSYQFIVDKMMERNPEDRYKDFLAIKKEIEANQFAKYNFSERDKKIYLEFANALNDTFLAFIDSKDFNMDVKKFSESIYNVIEKNIFEDTIQNNDMLLSCFIKGDYIKNDNVIKCSTVKSFFEWFETFDESTKLLILNNLKTKLEIKRKEYSDLPFD